MNLHAPVDWDGECLTLEKLPPPNTHRWVCSRKATVVNAVKYGIISREEVLERYSLSEEEFSAWERDADKYGIPGLRTTRLQHYHPKRRERQDA